MALVLQPGGNVAGSLLYYNVVPCSQSIPSCYHWHFIPYDPLTTGQYTAEVFGATDRAGLEMEAPYAWSFEVTEEIGGELLASPAEAPQTEEGREPAAVPETVPETVEPAAEEEPLEAPAGEGGEIEGGTPGVLYVRTTSYYYFGGQRVAMRQVDTWGGDVVYYLVTDHLGTTSLVLDAAGGRVAESRHYPYGAVRWAWPAEANGTLPTDYRFTGQRDVGLGLTHMGARFLDTSLGRWTSADTIVPGNASDSGGGAATMGYDEQVRLVPLTVGFHETQFLSVVGEENREIAAKGFWFQRSEREKSQSKYQWGPLNPQALNRYAYCLGNVLRYVDPTGHHQWTVVTQWRWGPLSRRDADERTAGQQQIWDGLEKGVIVVMPLAFGIPGIAIDITWWLFMPDPLPFHEGDYGSDTVYHDPDSGKYWRLVYYFDDDGTLLSHQQYFSWDGVNWVIVTDFTEMYPEEATTP